MISPTELKNIDFTYLYSLTKLAINEEYTQKILLETLNNPARPIKIGTIELNEITLPI